MLDGDGTLVYHAKALTSSSLCRLALRMIAAIEFDVLQECKLSRTALLSMKTTSWDPATSLAPTL